MKKWTGYETTQVIGEKISFLQVGIFAKSWVQQKKTMGGEVY